MPNDMIYKNLAKGIDKHSSLTNIKDGYSESLVNMDTNSGGSISTRKGYELHYGEIPIRITKVQKSGTSIRITLHSSQVVDLSTTTPGPIIIYGKLSTSQTGDFTNANRMHYYDTWLLDNKDSVSIGSNTITRTQVQHSYTTDLLWTGVSKSLQTVGNDNTYVMYNSMTYNQASKEVNINYIAGAVEDVFVYYKGFDNTVGESYTATVTAQTTVNINAATHQLDTYNILVRCFSDSAGVYTEAIPSQVSIDANGQVTVVFGSSFTGKIQLVSTITTYEGQAITGNNSIDIPNVTEPFNFISVYYYSGGVNYGVIPSSISYDESTQVLSVGYTINVPAESVRIFYTAGSIDNNTIRVTDRGGVSSSYTDNSPQLTLWGISHDNIYPNANNRGGHISHLDSYIRRGTSHLVAGLGGNFFKELDYDSDIYTDHINQKEFMPLYYVNMNERVNGNITLAPLFDTASNSRTHGECIDSLNDGHYATVTAVTYVSPGVVDYTLSFNTAQTITGKVTTSDKFTARNMPYSELSGEYTFISVSNDNSTAPVIRLANTNAQEYHNVTGILGGLACFTDNIPMLATSSAQVGDAIFYSSTNASETFSVIAKSVSTITIKGIMDTYSLADGLKLSFRRTTNLLPLKQLNGTLDVDNIVYHDKLIVNGVGYPVKVISIDTTANTVTLSESLTVAEGDTVYVEGRWFPIESPSVTSDLAPVTYVTHLDSNNYDEQPRVKSTTIKDNMYFTNNSDEVLKFDGTDILRAGLPTYQPFAFSNINTSGSIVPPTLTVALASPYWSANEFTVASGKAGSFKIGDRIIHGSNKYTVQSVNDTTNSVYVTETISGTPGAGDISLLAVYKNMFKINYIDKNNNIIYSAHTGVNDNLIELSAASNVKWMLVGLPHFEMYDHNNIEVKHYRTKANSGVDAFYLISTTYYSLNSENPYIHITDNTPDQVLKSDDVEIVPTEAKGNLLYHTSGPARAKFISSLNNRLILGNITSYPRWDITMSKVGAGSAITDSSLHGIKFGFSASYVKNSDLYSNNLIYNIISTSTPLTTSALTNNGGRASFTISSTIANAADRVWVYLYHSAYADNNDLRYCGWYLVYSSTSTTITLPVSHSGGTLPDKCFVSAEIPVWIGTDGNYADKEANTLGSINKAVLRLSKAINATNRQLLEYYPLIIANSGDAYQSGNIVIEQPFTGVTTTLTLTNPAAANVNIFCNGYLIPNAGTVVGEERRFPSRIIQSFSQYPEMFHGIYNDSGDFDYSVMDINAADGQEITGGIGFFGDSTFGSGTLGGAFVVFKTNSIYVYDTETRQYQKIESRGLGCTAPSSITTTKDGVMFANETGVYRLNRDLSIIYIGQLLDREWDLGVSKLNMEEIVGHHYRAGKQYKISVPAMGEFYNSKCYVYDHTSEGDTYGAWTTYTNHRATMWANLNSDAFFGSFKGKVFKIRNRGIASDFRDDDSAISIEWRTGGLDFGSFNKRKYIHKAFIEFQQTTTNITGVALSTRVNLKGDFKSCGNITKAEDTTESSTARLSIPDKNCVNIQFKLTHNTLDEEIVVTGLGFSVDGLDNTGIREAKGYT